MDPATEGAQAGVQVWGDRALVPAQALVSELDLEMDMDLDSAMVPARAADHYLWVLR